MEGRCVLAPETGRLACRRYCQTMGAWEADDRNRCLDVMSARRVKHDCRYPGTVPLLIRWTAVDVVERWSACCDRPTMYKGNQPSPYRNLTWRKTDMNFEEKETIYKVTENSDASPKKLKSETKNKLRRRRNVVEKSQSESKKFDAIDVGLYRSEHQIYAYFRRGGAQRARILGV